MTDSSELVRLHNLTPKERREHYERKRQKRREKMTPEQLKIDDLVHEVAELQHKLDVRGLWIVGLSVAILLLLGLLGGFHPDPPWVAY
jgi:hypothetical protein